jgi:hypothetical protein
MNDKSGKERSRKRSNSLGKQIEWGKKNIQLEMIGGVCIMVGKFTAERINYISNLKWDDFKKEASKKYVISKDNKKLPFYVDTCFDLKGSLFRREVEEDVFTIITTIMYREWKMSGRNNQIIIDQALYLLQIKNCKDKRKKRRDKEDMWATLTEEDYELCFRRFNRMINSLNDEERGYAKVLEACEDWIYDERNNEITLQQKWKLKSDLLLEEMKLLDKNLRARRRRWISLRFKPNLKDKMMRLLFAKSLKQNEVSLSNTDLYSSRAFECITDINFEEVKLLKGKLNNYEENMEELLKKEIRICLGKLKSRIPLEGKQWKGVGKEKNWNKMNQKEMVMQNRKILKMGIMILTRKVRLKKREYEKCIVT